MLRSSASNEEAAERLRIAIFRDQIVPMVARLRGEEAGAREIAALIASQTVGLAYTRYVLKLPPLVALPRETIIRVIGATIQRYLDNPLKEE
jgi:hypothetical protein